MKKFYVIAFTLMLVSFMASAQTAEQIAANVASASKVNTAQTIVLHGELTEYGHTSTFLTECRSDDKALLHITMQGRGTTTLCWNAGSGWQQNEIVSGTTKRPIKGMTEYEIRNISLSLGFIPRPEKASSLTLLPPSTINGIAVFVLKAVFSPDDERTVFVRQDNFLPMREIRKELNQGNYDVIVDYTDYQTVGSITLPTTITKTVAGKEISLRHISKIEINTQMPDALFSAETTSIK